MVARTFEGSAPTSDWSLLEQGIRSVLPVMLEDTDALMGLLRRVELARGAILVFDEDDEDESARAGLLRVGLDLDLVLIAEDDVSSRDALEALIQVLEFARENVTYELALRVGSRDATLVETRAAIVSVAQAHGILLRGLPSLYAPESQQERSVTDDDAWASEEHASAHEREAASWSFFGDEESEDEQQGELWAEVALTQDARDFLAAARLRWPVSLGALEESWRAVAFAAHPDRAPDDPSAGQRFVALRRGFEELRLLKS